MSTTGKAQLLSPQDLGWKEVISLDQKHFERAWSDNNWQELNPQHHLVASWTKSDKILGFALFHYLPGEDMAHLLKIMILEDFRKKGEASHFFNSLVKYLKSQNVSRVYLEVERSNFAAINFYEKLGFKTLRVLKAYYSDGTDAQSMELTL